MLPTVPLPAHARQRVADADVVLPREAARSHRVCAPEHATWVEANCLADRQLLPRWHQADRRRHRVAGAPAGGVHVMAPDGAYAGLECWRSREHWLTVVVPVVLATRATAYAGQVSRTLLARYLRVVSGWACPRTGRRCVVRPVTVASVLGVDERTVQRCRAAARAIGLEVVVLTGRMLTEPERKEAQASGSTQRGLSTEVAFTIPRGIPRHLLTATPSRGPLVDKKQDWDNTHLDAASGEKTDATPSRPRHRGRHGLKRGRRLAADLAQIVPWLATERPGRLAPALHRFATCTPVWRAGDLSVVLADVVRRRGHNPAGLSEHAIRTRPAVVLASLLRDVDEVADHPSIAHQWATPPPAPQPCGHPDCDGHGWLRTNLHVDDHAGGLLEAARAAAAGPATSSVPCPRCPAMVRAGHHHDEEPAF